MATDAESLPFEVDEEHDHRRTDWWAEVRGIFWLVVAVLGFHSLIAKSFFQLCQVKATRGYMPIH